MKYYDHLSEEKYRRDTRNKGKQNRWLKKQVARSNRRQARNELRQELPIDSEN